MTAALREALLGRRSLPAGAGEMLGRRHGVSQVAARGPARTELLPCSALSRWLALLCGFVRAVPAAPSSLLAEQNILRSSSRQC